MKNKVGLLMVAAVGLVVVLGCSKITDFAKKAAENANSGEVKSTSSFTLAGKEWSSYDIEGTAIKVDLPGKPADKTPPDAMMPAGYKGVFSGMHVWSYDDKDFQSSYTEMVFKIKRNWKIKELAETSMTAIKKQIPGLQYTLDIKSDSNAKYNGSFSKNGKDYDLRGCCVYKKGKDPRVWAVITLIPKSNADAQSASERIISSAIFGASGEECE